jgi:hypothetical protein
MWKVETYHFNHGTRQIRDVEIGVVRLAQGLETLVVRILLVDEHNWVNSAVSDFRTFANLAS